MYKIRARYEKTGRTSYLGHLEVIKVFERAFRRAGVPMKHTEGFNPHPKISFALPSSVGFSSQGEYIEVEVTERIEERAFLENVNRELPEGLGLLCCGYLQGKTRSLMSLVDYSAYRVDYDFDGEETPGLPGRLAELFEKGPIPVRKRTKSGKMTERDLKTFIHDFQLISATDDGCSFWVLLAAGSRGNLNPALLMKGALESLSLSMDPVALSVCRLDLFMKAEEGPVSLEKTIGEPKRL